MLVTNEAILVLVIASFQFSVVNSSPSPIATKYELVSVEANSFISIRTTNLAVQGYNALLCASMCTANANCESYYYETSHCYESASSSLIGSIPNLTSSKNVYIDEDIYNDGQWIWGPWSTCSKTCGIGTQTRSAINCNGTRYAGMPCSGNGTEIAACQIEGGWALWGSWNMCSATCGTGTRSRLRNYFGGIPCVGSADETESCKVEGIWSSWDPWGTCSGVCDINATQTRVRNITGGTVPCSGSNIETAGCNVEGTWSMWGPFGVCSGTCDITATHNRTRNYTGGTMPCAGNSIEVAIGCQVEGVWGSWGPYGTCSGACDSTATHSRTRNYTGGTMPCQGSATEVSVGCQVEGTWGNWDPWGACTGTCDSTASQNRTRTFTGGTIPCTGNAVEIAFGCSVEGSWSSWGAWSSCSGSPVTRSHTRTYSGGVRPCSGIDTELETCCVNPSISFNQCHQSCISFQQCYQGCSSTMGGGQHSFQGEGVFADNVPETSYDHYWMGDVNSAPQRLRITFSCPRTISSVTLRNSGQATSTKYPQPERGTNQFEINVREPNSSMWIPFVSGRLSDANNVAPPLETFNGPSYSVDMVEFTCLSWYGGHKHCALGYIEFS